MATEAPSTVFLKSTTKITLNERFSNLAKVSPLSGAEQQRLVRNVNAAADRHSVSKNRRLAQQMANRIQAAGEDFEMFQDDVDTVSPELQRPVRQQRRSVSERLGHVTRGGWLLRSATAPRLDVKSRLAFSTASALAAAGDFEDTPSVYDRLAFGQRGIAGVGRGRLGGRHAAGRVLSSARRGRGSRSALDNCWLSDSYSSPTTQAAATGRVGREYSRKMAGAATARQAGRGRRGRAGSSSVAAAATARGGLTLYRGRGTPAARARGFRGQRVRGAAAAVSARGRNRGRGKRGNGAAAKEDLDRQLDEYMAQTKPAFGLP